MLTRGGRRAGRYVLEQLDVDGDGVVTWQEFESMLGDGY